MTDKNSPFKDSGFVTTQDAAGYLGVTVMTVNRWVRDGKLTAYGEGGKGSVRRFKREDVENFYKPTPIKAG